MIRVGWAKDDPLFRRVFTRIFVPDATEEQMRWFDELQRVSTSPENAVASRIGRQAVDIYDELPRIAVPTLILQALGDRATTFDNAIQVASRVPDARLRARQREPHPPRRRGGVGDLRRRGPRLPRARSWAADGSTDLGRATLTSRARRTPSGGARLRQRDDRRRARTEPATVERHLSNAYSKLGVTGKAARAAAVAEVVRQGLA